MSKRILSVLLTLCMLLSMFPMVLPVSAEETAADVIEIGTAEQLVALMGKEEIISGNYKLTENIDLTGYDQAPIGISEAYHFTGTFDGNNKTISGINISGTKCVALFGYARDMVIKDLTISGTISGSEDVAGFVGFAHGGSTGMGRQTITIENCINDCDINATGNYVGGIVGYLRNTYTNSALISGCTNTGRIDSDGTHVGGIVGYNSSNGTGTVTITKCRNAEAVSASKNIGGIVGWMTGQDTSATNAKYLITECWNSASVASDVASGTANAGGIIGYAEKVGNVSDCLNTGVVSSAVKNIGGILGQSKTLFGGHHCLTKTPIECAVTDNYANSTMGFPVSRPVGNIYYYGEVQGKDWDLNGVTLTFSYTAALFDDLNTSGNWVIAADPELAVFHTHNYVTYETAGTAGHHQLCACGAANEVVAHVDEDTNGTCDVCGGVTACSHEGTEKTWVTVSTSTCNTAGVEKEICSCGSETGVTRNLEFDATKHEAIDYVWQKEGETYFYACTACSAHIVEQAELPTVCVDAYSKADDQIGSDDATGTADDEVYTVEEAIRRLANVGGIVRLTDRYYTKGVITFPTHAEPITITTYNGTSFKSGFYFTGETCFILGGDTTFEHIYLFSDTNKAKELIIQANWNDLTIGDEVATGVTGYIVAGTTGMTGDDLEAKDTTITLSGVNQFSKGTGDNSEFETKPTFYNKIFLGNRIITSDSIPEGGCTVSNKKVTLNAVEGVGYPEIDDLYLITISPVATPLVATTNHETVVNLNGTSTIATLMSGFKNTDGGAGYLDKLVLNLNDNSDVLKYYAVKNVKNVEMNVSTAADGRTTKATSPVFTKGSGYAPDGTETIVANYGEHSFAKTALANGFIQGSHYNAMYEGRVTTNIVKECTFDDGVVTTPAAPGVAGVLTKTCSECGRKITEDVPYVCTEHVYVAKADGTYYCANSAECEITAAPEGNTVTVSAAADGDTVTVTLNASIADALVGATLYVTAPEGFTLTGAAKGEVINSLEFVTADDTTNSSYKIGFIDTTLTDSVISGELATLTYTKGADVEDGTYVFVVAADEAYNVDEEAIAITGIGGELVVAAEAACAHENTKTTNTATCEEAGVETVVCEDCGEKISETAVEALGHTELVLKETAVDPTCTTAGKTAVMGCERCDYTEGGIEVPENGHNHVKGDLTPATRETEAYYTYTCDVCGDSYTEEVKGEPLDFTYGHSVVFASEYVLKFRVPVKKVATVDLEGGDDHWMEIIKYPYNEEGVAVPTTYIVEAVSGKSYHDFQVPGIPAKNMNDKLEGVYYQIIDGIKYEATVDNYGLVAYLNALETYGDQYATTIDLVKAMMNYGSAAQAYFNYNTTHVEGDPNSGYINLHLADETERMTFLEDFKDVEIGEHNRVVEDYAGQAFEFNGNSGVFKSKITLDLKFKVKDAAALDTIDTLVFKGTYTDVNGGVKTFEISGADNIYTTGTKTKTLHVLVDCVPVKDLRQMVTGELYDANGNKVSQTVSSSIGCYTYAIAENTAFSDAERALVKGVYAYSQQAQISLGN